MIRIISGLIPIITGLLLCSVIQAQALNSEGLNMERLNMEELDLGKLNTAASNETLITEGAAQYLLAQKAKSPKPRISKAAAANIARNHVGGKVLKITFSGSFYTVKVLSSSGHVKQVFVDANTGQVR